MCERKISDSVYWNNVYRNRFYLTMFETILGEGDSVSMLIDSVLKKYGLRVVDSVFVSSLHIIVKEVVSEERLSPGTIIEICGYFRNLQEYVFTFEPIPVIKKVEVYSTTSCTPLDYQSATPGQKWPLAVSRVDSAWCFTTGGNEWIAILDDAIDWTHEDLQEYAVAGYDYADNDLDPTPPAPDQLTHGTAVSSVAIASIFNFTGMWGVVNDTLYFCKIATDGGVFGGLPTVKAFNDLLQMEKVKVVSMSWGSYAYNATEHQLIIALHDSGKLLVAAIGNNSSSQPFFPAALPEVMAVGAADAWEPDPANPGVGISKAGFSNYGDYMDILAPGGTYRDANGGYHAIRVAQPSNTYSWAVGTSLSAPFVAGIGALVFSVNPCLNGKAVRKILNQTALDVYPPGKDPYSGHGLVMADRAVKAALPIDLSRATLTVVPTICGYCTGGVILKLDSLYDGYPPVYVVWDDGYTGTLLSGIESHVRFEVCGGERWIYVVDSLGCGDTIRFNVPCSDTFLSTVGGEPHSLPFSVVRKGRSVYLIVPDAQALPMYVSVYSSDGRAVLRRRVERPGVYPLLDAYRIAIGGVYYVVIVNTFGMMTYTIPSVISVH